MGGLGQGGVTAAGHRGWRNLGATEISYVSAGETVTPTYSFVKTHSCVTEVGNLDFRYQQGSF